MAEGEDAATHGVAVDRSERPSGILRVLLLALVILALSALVWLLPARAGTMASYTILAILAAVGMSCLFAWVVGIVHFGQTSVARNDLTKLIADESPEGILVTNREGRVIYANTAYLTLTGAVGEQDMRTVERAFTGDPDVSEATYRLAQAARAGQRLTEEFRIASAPPAGAASWYRVRVRPVTRPSGPAETVWTVADITRERERQENVFQELQHAHRLSRSCPGGLLFSRPVRRDRLYECDPRGLARL